MDEKKWLDKAAHEPHFIKKMTLSQLLSLASEIRERLVQTTSRTGGHLASNLGSVELTLALLRVLDVPKDKIVWDVGHQCYAYKMLTGRLDRFDTLRQEGGISGFPKSAESEYDSFVSGHASTSLAAAYGLKRAMTLSGDPHTVTAVVGDGSFTGGMIYEGLNNIGKSRENLIVILNDNEMAISKNEGALARYLSVLRAKPEYFRMKEMTERTVQRIPIVGKPLRDVLSESKTILKRTLYPSTFFEEFGFTYFGPVDGHDLPALCSVLMQAKQNSGPSFVHIETKKGKGYAPAEKNPGEFHGVSSFDAVTGKPIAPPKESFSSVFGREICALAEKDPTIVAITAAMEHGTCLQYFARQFKRQGRYYDVGIAEEFGATFAAGLAAGGKIPVFAVYSTFLQRSYDQLIHDAAIEKRHIVLCVDRAGIVGDDGETHQGVFDAAFLSTVPGMTVWSPSNYAELQSMLSEALYHCTGPAAVRYPRGGEDAALSGYVPTGEPFDLLTFSDPAAKDTLLVTYGRTATAALDAAKQANGTCDVLKLNRIVPIDPAAVKAAMQYRRVFFAEEGIRTGGIGMQFLSQLALSSYRGSCHLRAIDGFVPQSTVSSALQKLGLDRDGLYQWLGETTT